MIKQIIIFSILVFFISCAKNTPSNFMKNGVPQQTIDSLIKASRKVSIAEPLRNDYVIRAYKKIELLDDDSLKTKFYIRIAYSNLVLGNLNEFGRISHKTLKLAINNKDTINQARANSDLGYFYHIKFKSDSAFYFYRKALKLYKLKNDKLLEGKMLLSIATIQSNEKDYSGSEINTIKAISKLKNSNQFKNLFLCYNNLAFISNQQKKYEESIEYREKGIKYLDRLNNQESLRLIAFNGIGLSYRLKKEYSKSIDYFKRALTTKNLPEKYPEIYALLIDNLAYSKFKLGHQKGVLKLFFTSLKIRDSLNLVEGIVINSLHLGEYFFLKQDTTKAIYYLKKAKKLAISSNNNGDLLTSYFLLSKLGSAEKGKEYLQKYIKLTDSLQQQERAIREKFTRIAYETDEILKEKDAEVKKKWWVISFSGIALSFSVLLLINAKQRSKNKELLFNKQQDEANVEIYNLMLAQQTVFQKGSNLEKKRISEELHDGILGRLFGTRLSLDSLNETNTEKAVKERLKDIKELQLIEEDIRKISHNLKTSLFHNDTNFIKLIKQLIAKQSKISSFEFKLIENNRIKWEKIPNSIKINCYRILQEAIQNTHKYAEATEFLIEFNQGDEYLLFQVKDNGIGFNLKKKRKGIGLKNIESRVQKLGGKVTLLSKPSRGTQIIMELPLSGN